MSFTAASSAEDQVLARSRWPGGQLIDAWYRNEQRAVWIMLGCFVVVWTTYHCLANASIGLHTDNLEMFVWSRHPQAGYSSHPPLAAWIVAAWFAVFPTTDWAYNLLAMLNAAAALVVAKVDRLARSQNFLSRILEAGVEVRFSRPSLRG